MSGTERRIGRARAVAACVVLLLSAAPARPQGESPNLVSGVVRAPDESPVAGAEVRLVPESEEAGAPSTATDARGRWSLVGVRPGRWELEIDAGGFLPVRGWVTVPAVGSPPVVEVELRSLEEHTARFWEGSPATIRNWLERANALLANGRPAEAREEYEKALAVLPVGERPPVLEAVARTRFLQGEPQKAVDALLEALRIEADSERLQTLLAALLGPLGRAAETEELIAAARAAGPPPAARPQPRPTPPRRDEEPLVAAGAGRTGAFRCAFAESSPSSSLEVYLERFGIELEEIRGNRLEEGTYDLARESFSVVVPDAMSERQAPGLLVWISPTANGAALGEEEVEVLAERRLIWIGANDAGNDRASWQRAALALDAAHNMVRLYGVDPERVYVGGYSGGGRLASALALLYPEVFRGGLFAFGCDYFRPIPVPFKPGASWPARFPAPAADRLARLERESRLVYLSGELDFNRSQTKAVWKQARRDGFELATYLEIPAADHYHGIDGEWLAKAFEALDRGGGAAGGQSE